MTPCALLERFLDGRLESDRRPEFEAHLTVCEDCRSAVDGWRSVKETYASWVDSTTRLDDDTGRRVDPPAFAASVLEAIETEGASTRTSRRSAPRAYYHAAAAAVLLGLLGSIFYFVAGNAGSIPQPSGVATPPAEPLAFSAVFISNGVKTDGLVEGGPENIIEAPEDGRILAALNGARVGLAGSGKMRVAAAGPERTEVQLLHGTTAFEVSPRRDEARFQVRAGEISVEVIGTRFSVAMDENEAVTVSVDRGVVSVFSDKWRVELEAGSSITVSHGEASPPESESASAREMETLAGLLSEDASPVAEQPPPAALTPSVGKKDVKDGVKRPVSSRRNIEKWRALIIDGKAHQAEKAIGDYLSTSPRDAEALMLLATSQKKQGRYQKAVDSYKRVLASADKRFANRAYYLAGELSYSKLKDFRGAVKLFEGYLRRTPSNAPNRPEAMLMHAESLLGVGANARAKTRLKQIIADYGRMPIANRARALLRQLRGEVETPE